MSQQLKVGSVVTGRPGIQLVSGSGRYPDAIVTSISPLVLMSRAGDMKWFRITEDSLEVIGKAWFWQVWYCKWKAGPA